MIRELHLRDVGPSRALDFEFAPRLNILTGDNGLGKSFVLDIAWWTLTTTWAGDQAFPWQPRTSASSLDQLAPEIDATLSYAFGDGTSAEEVLTGGTYEWSSQRWKRKRWERRPPGKTDVYSHPPDSPSALVVYARIDGSFAIWDGHQVKSEHAEATVLLNSEEVWEGKESETRGTKRRRTICRGLLEDWVTWQGAHAPEFESLARVLTVLSEPDEPLVPGPPTRVRLDDRQDVPTLEMAYGLVPVTLASAGQRRVLALAYMLVWAWAEHLKTAELKKRSPTGDMIVLIDEVEVHLHPRWQRLLLPAIMQAIKAIAPDVSVQLIATTHAPMVLASVEPYFDEETDDLYRFERSGSAVVAHRLQFAKQGDVANWLVSETFGLEPRSAPSEAAIEAASAFMRGDTAASESALKTAVEALDNPPFDPSSELKARIHATLRRLVPSHDDFWPRWIVSNDPSLARDEDGR